MSIKVKAISLSVISLCFVGTTSAQDLGSLFGSMGIDSETLAAAGIQMGGEANPEAAHHYKEGTEAGMAGDYNRAIPHLKRATEISPNFAGAHFNLACAYAKKGNTSAALAALKKAVKIDAGYKAKAKRDGDLTSLREQPEFLAIVR